MRPHNNPLFLVLTAVLVLASACSSATLREQKVEAKIAEVQPQQSPIAVTAIVKAKKANVREHPSPLATVVRTLSKGDLLSLTDETPTGAWYRIRDNKTSADGWIHGNTIALLQTAETTAASTTSAQRPRTVSTPTKTSRTIAPKSEASRTKSAPTSNTPFRRSSRSYVNVDGIRVQSPTFSDTKPTGASARCRDGSYSFSLNRRGTCSHHGGVAEWY
jgi:uncharacterized protein YgiM (DUF1202 family)